MTELRVYSDNADKAYSQQREPFDLDINFSNDGVADFLSNVDSRKQLGYISAYIKRGTMPLAPSTGIDWADFVDGKTSWAVICAQIDESIQNNCGPAQFVAQLSTTGDRPQLNIVDLKG